MEILLFFGYWGMGLLLSTIAAIFSKYWPKVIGLYGVLALIFGVIVFAQSQRIDRIKPLIIPANAGKVSFIFTANESANYNFVFYSKDKKEVFFAFPNVSMKVKGNINHELVTNDMYLYRRSFFVQKGERIPISFDYQFIIDKEAEKNSENLAVLKKAVRSPLLLEISANAADQSINLGLFSIPFWLNIPIILALLFTGIFLFICIKKGSKLKWKIWTSLLCCHFAAPFLTLSLLSGVCRILDIFISVGS